MEDYQTCVDVLDLRFRAGPKVRIFEEWSNYNSPLHLVASINKHGLLVVGAPHGLVVFKLKDLLENEEGEACPRRTIPMENITHLAVNCDDTLLIAVINANNTCHGYIIDVKSLVNQKNVLPLGTTVLSNQLNQHVQELAWNPTVPNYLCVCFTGGSLTMIDIKPHGVVSIVNSMPTAKATCVSWSPKGKQLVAGSKDGTLVQHTPELKVVKTVPLPTNLTAACEPLSVCWLSSFQFAVVYKITSVEENRLSLCIVDAPKQGLVSCIEYDDICYSSAELRVNQFYLNIIHSWNILMCASANGMEVGVLGQCNVQSQPPKWQQWCMEDSARAELPMEGVNETFPIGLTLNTSATERLTWGEETIPPMPVLAVLSQRGFLCLFHVMNLKSEAPILCCPPVSIPGEISSLFVATNFPTSSKEITKSSTTVPSVTVSSSIFDTPQPPLIRTQFMSPPALPTMKPLASQAVVPIAKPVAQQPSNSIQLIEKPSATTQAVKESALPVLQPTTTSLKKTPENSSGAKFPEDVTVDLSTDVFNNVARNVIVIFQEEITSALKRVQEEPSQIDLFSAGEFIDKIQGIQNLTSAFRNELKDTAGKKDIKLQLLHERNHKDYVNIKNRLSTRNLSEMTHLIKNQPLDLSTKNMLDAVEIRMLYMKTEAHDASKILNKIEMCENNRNKYEITDKMALSKSIHMQSQILNELDTKYKHMERSATLDPNIRYHHGAANRHICMKSIADVIEKTVSACLHDTLFPLSLTDEILIAQHSSSEIVPVVASINEPIISPNKSPFKSILSSTATAWKSPAASSTPTKPKAPQNSVVFTREKLQNKSFGVNIFSDVTKTVSEPVYERISSVESSETSSSDQDELTTVNPLNLLGSTVDKIKPSLNFSTAMVDQRKKTAPTSTTGQSFGGSALFSNILPATTSSIKTTPTLTAPKFNTAFVSTAPSSVTASTPSLATVTKPSNTVTLDVASKNLFGSITSFPSTELVSNTTFGPSSSRISLNVKSTSSAVTPFKFAASKPESLEMENAVDSKTARESKSLNLSPSVTTNPNTFNESSSNVSIKSIGVTSSTTGSIFGGLSNTGISLFSGKNLTVPPEKTVESINEPLSALTASTTTSAWNLTKPSSTSKNFETTEKTTFSFTPKPSVFGTASIETTSASAKNTTAVVSASSPTSKAVTSSDTLPTFETTEPTTSLSGTTATVSSFCGKSSFDSAVTCASSPSAFGASTVKILPVTSVSFTSSGTLFETAATSASSATTTGITAPTIVFKTPTVTGTLFGSSTTTTNSSETFGTPVTTQSVGSVFGSPTPFEIPSTSASSVFNTSNTFGSQNSSVLTQSSTTTAVSGVKSTNAPSLFGDSDSTPSSTFGTLKSENIFGGSELSSAFGSTGSRFTSTCTTTTNAFSSNLFGQVAPVDSNTSQVSSMFGGLMSSGGNVFQQTSFSKSASSIFGGGTSSPIQSSQNVFGNVQACSPKNENKNLFGPTSPPNPFSKQSVSTVFGQSHTPSRPFSSQSQNVFGQSNSGPFSGGVSSGASPFSSPPDSGNIFAAPPSFGSTSPGAFGAPPAFGAAAAFGPGVRTDLFGTTSNAPATVFGSAAGQSQEASGFGALASQSTVSFGNLAQQNPTGFAGFGPSQNNNQAHSQQQQQQQTSTFGGSSFSSWR